MTDPTFPDVPGDAPTDTSEQSNGPEPDVDHPDSDDD